MHTTGECRWATNKNKFEDLFVNNMDELISHIDGFISRLIDFPTWKKMYEIADSDEATILRVALLTAGNTFNFPYGYFERSYHEQQALKQGIFGSFGVIDPIDTKGEIPFRPLYLPLEEARIKWAEYQQEKLDCRFTYTEVEVAVYSQSTKTVTIPGVGEWKISSEGPDRKRNNFLHTMGYALSLGDVMEYNRCYETGGMSVVVVD